MKATEFFQWWIVDPGKTRPRLTRWRMTREEAQARHPGATPHVPSREVRSLPESPAEVPLPSAGWHGPGTTTGMPAAVGEADVKRPENAA
jgi:hypothetical protein